VFKWAAHDDLYDELYPGSCVKLLEENPDIILAYAAFIDEKSEPSLSNRRQEAL
jgi:hypothetical protein